MARGERRASREALGPVAVAPRRSGRGKQRRKARRKEKIERTAGVSVGVVLVVEAEEDLATDKLSVRVAVRGQGHPASHGLAVRSAGAEERGGDDGSALEEMRDRRKTGGRSTRCVRPTSSLSITRTTQTGSAERTSLQSVRKSGTEEEDGQGDAGVPLGRVGRVGGVDLVALLGVLELDHGLARGATGTLLEAAGLNDGELEGADHVARLELGLLLVEGLEAPREHDLARTGALEVVPLAALLAVLGRMRRG